MKFNRETIATISSIGGSDSGIIKLASGTITDPVAYLDLALSNEYIQFQLLLKGFNYSIGDYIVLTISVDGGTTFINDIVNYDSYYISGYHKNMSDTGVLYYSFADAVCSPAAVFSQNDALFGQSGTIVIDPGSDTSFFTISTEIMITSNGESVNTHKVASLVNTAATVPPTPARANVIRMTPYGNGDVNPPTSGETIIAGSWVLLGVPNPS